MGTGPDGLAESFLHGFPANGNAVLFQLFDHFPVADVSGILKKLDAVEKERILVIKIQSHNVNVFSMVFCGKFNAGDYFQAGAFGCQEGFIQAGNSIVVGKGKGLEMFFQCVLDKFGGR